MSRASLYLASAVVGAILAPAAAAYAAEDVWNFSGPQGVIGLSETVLSTPDNEAETITGFTTLGTPDILFQKNLGGLEVGIGETDDPSGLNEITAGNFVQIDLSKLTAGQLLSLSFGASSDSVDFNGNPERWGLALSNTSGIEGTVVQTGNADFPTVATIDAAGFRFLDVTDVTSGPGNGILLREIDAAALPVGVPEPSTWATMVAALASLGSILWLRRRRS